MNTPDLCDVASLHSSQKSNVNEAVEGSESATFTVFFMAYTAVVGKEYQEREEQGMFEGERGEVIAFNRLSGDGDDKSEASFTSAVSRGELRWRVKRYIDNVAAANADRLFRSSQLIRARPRVVGGAGRGRRGGRSL